MSETTGLRAIFDVRRGERAVAGLMAFYFFLVITSFWILKPIKKTLFISHYAADGFNLLGGHFDAPSAELLAKVMNMLVAALAVIVFSALARRLRRERLAYVFTSFFLLAYGAFAFVGPASSGLSVWAFYLFGDLFSTLMVATFFAFLNDSVTSDAAKRLYGIVGFGGVLGGVFGASAVGVWIREISPEAWLGIAALLAGVILVVARGAAAALEKSPSLTAANTVPTVNAANPAEAPPAKAANPALAGARLVFRSSYLLSIVAIVGLYELVSTLLDFQFTSAVFEFAPDEATRNQHYATVYAITNWLSMGVQLFLTSFVMRRFGLGVALLMLPAAIVLSSLGFLLTPSLLFGSLLSISDNGLNYSINQSSKEALYVPTTVEEKYQAKAFIDMFVQRMAKALGVGVGLLAQKFFVGFAAIPFLSLVVLPIALLWGGAALYAGRRFKALERGDAAVVEGRGERRA